jgi:hypothetical protein
MRAVATFTGLDQFQGRNISNGYFYGEHPMAEDIRVAIQRELLAAGGTPDNPVDLLEIGVTLVQRGFNQVDIADALYGMESNGIVHLISGDRVVLLQSLPDDGR